MKRVLIISPHFPPVNAPDMQRVRMSLPYFREMGWEPVIICVNRKYVEGFFDEMLCETIPPDIEVHKVKAWPIKLTRKLGLGSLSIRSLFYFKKKGNELIRSRKFDLIYFSTTAFHVCWLGKYWKKKFDIPFVIDIQDPWRNDFYLDKPRELRPPKYRLAYNIHKKLEAITMPHVDGIISVSEAYIITLRARYNELKATPMKVIEFGASELDFEIIKKYKIEPQIIDENNLKINVVYIGAVTSWFLPLIKAFLISFKNSVKYSDKYHFYFIGTSYSKGENDKKVYNLAASLQMEHLVTEVTDRIPYFNALSTLIHADILFVPGSMDTEYNASKVYNNILARTPIFSIFNEKSLVKRIIELSDSGIVVGVNGNETESELVNIINYKMPEFEIMHLEKKKLNKTIVESFTARKKCEEQVQFFSLVLS